MLALGIILVLIAAGAAIAAVFGGTGQPATFDLGVVEVQTNTLGSFLLGAVTVVVLVLGLALIRAGAARARRRRQERKELKTLHKRMEAGGGTAAGATAGGAHTTTGEPHAAGGPAEPSGPHDTPGSSTPPR
jgi:hypothetical protein